jgi:predicted transcriptional regulator
VELIRALTVKNGASHRLPSKKANQNRWILALSGNVFATKCSDRNDSASSACSYNPRLCYICEIKLGVKMAGEAKYQGAYAQLVTKIIASYVSHHNVGPEQIPDLISSVQRTFDNLGKPIETQGALTPAVPVRRSVQRDAVVCLECGWKGKMLRRHLSTRHALTGELYLKRWSLPNDHPLTAPTYSAQRSNLAKELGLGRGGRPLPEEEAPPPVTEAPRPRRGRPRRNQTDARGA